MYEHRYSADIALFDPVCLGSTSKGLAAAARAQVFGDDFVRTACVNRPERSPSSGNERQYETSTGTQLRL
jgi:hypothetical protein